MSKYTTEEQLLKEYIEELINEKSWSDLDAPKGKIITLSPEDFAYDDDAGETQLADQIFDLIQNAYADVEIEPGKFGNVKVQSAKDLPAGYTNMTASDIDSDDDPDYFRGGKERGGRNKLGIVGHDGSSAAIKLYLDKTAELLKSGSMAEMSGKIAHIMITRYGVPAVTDQASVESMIGKPVEWIGQHPEDKYASRYGDQYHGWYNRKIGSKSHMKILLGGI